MARNKEGLLFLLDVGPSMHYILPEIEKVCSMLVQKKLIYNKHDEVGIVLFGTEETKNELTKEVGGYEHVFVLRDIKVVDGDLVDALRSIPRGTIAGDFLDAVVVGMDMLIKKYGTTNKGKKRLCLITDAANPIKDPLGETKEDQVSTIAGTMATRGMRMETVIVRGRLSGKAEKSAMEENDLLLKLFSEKAHAKTVYVDSPTKLLGALKTRNISPVTVYRGDLEITPKMKVKVWVYKKTQEEKFPTLKKYSDKAPPNDRLASHELKVDYEYKSIEDPDKVVPPEQRIKGYRYGPQVVPISSAELDAFKFKPEKSVKLLGFTNASNIMRHYYMKDVYVFVPEPGNSKAALAVSAIARAMKEVKKVAILRCVWRQGQGNVVVGVLTPNLSEKDNVPDSFYFNLLPFAEDVREFRFPSFSNFPASLQPNEQQQELADNFVKMLDLAPSGEEEALQPDFTPNPVLERFYRFLDLKSKHPDAAVPPLDDTLKKITEPDPELISDKRPIIDAFSSEFELKDNPKLKRSKRLLQEKPSGSNEGGNYLEYPDAHPANSKNNSPAIKIETVGNLTPIQDFEAMMSRRDSAEWVGKAIKDMTRKIFNLVEDSYEGDNYSKALECLVALRKGCILEQEPEKFNNFLRDLCKFCQEKDLSSFCEYLASNGLKLISKSEAIDSEVSDEEAKSFLVKKEPKDE